MFGRVCQIELIKGQRGGGKGRKRASEKIMSC